ncbi:hypothetical protein N7510_001795 [Penicillium lagena]|uniref:uncharacterized protein n=1 Tax=Penicillium lagena TaxID=94218 RepID=UPI0025421916|nr:uncharacterized protein N7510_001795 [Penicillium lagena]KAJ5625486.1 hypothetical protein N7510_001795 [Penicillium lagena]
MSAIDPEIFKASVVVVSGSFAKYNQGDVKRFVEAHGGKLRSTVTDDCTHLITSQKDVDKKPTKYLQAAKRATCQIVSLDWLLDSVEAKKALPEKPYLLASGDPSTKDGNLNGSAAEKNEDKKRPANGAAEAEPTNKKLKNAQIASSNSLKVPADKAFVHQSPNFQNPKVYIDDTGLIWDATLNQTNASSNNNKFYRIQILVGNTGTEFVTWTHWGRVGEYGQSSILVNGALTSAKNFFVQKFKDKSGLKWENRLDPPKRGKYTFIEREYEKDDEDLPKEAQEDKVKIESALPKPTQELLSFIFDADNLLSTMAELSYDPDKLPLGKLSERTLKAGFSILNELSELIAGPELASSTQVIEALSNRYFTTIPHIFGRNRPPMLNTDAQIKKEIELLETLTEMDITNDIMKKSKDGEEINQLDRQFQGLGLQELTQLDHQSTEFKELENYLSISRGATHSLNYQIIDIFRIERKGEIDRLSSSRFAKMKNSNRRLLWHGSRSTNFGGILSQGLRIAPPEAPVSGYMFGKGVYLADTSSKSANYCHSHNSNNKGLLLLCEVELGEPMLELYENDYRAGEKARVTGRVATLGKGTSTPGGWKDASCVYQDLEGVKMPDVAIPTCTDDAAFLQYNEYIVYDVAQIRQRYLFYTKMT